jgi:hypothetical protein
MDTLSLDIEYGLITACDGCQMPGNNAIGYPDWRQQPYGHQRKKRKLIWIKPHEKGPDYAQAVNKPYQVM